MPFDSSDGESTDSSSNLGAIIGGTVAGVAVVLLAGVGGWLLARKRAGKGEPLDLDPQPPKEPDHASQDTQAYQTDGYGAPRAWGPRTQHSRYPETQHELSTARRTELPVGY